MRDGDDYEPHKVAELCRKSTSICTHVKVLLDSFVRIFLFNFGITIESQNSSSSPRICTYIETFYKFLNCYTNIWVSDYNATYFLTFDIQENPPQRCVWLVSSLQSSYFCFHCFAVVFRKRNSWVRRKPFWALCSLFFRLFWFPLHQKLLWRSQPASFLPHTEQLEVDGTLQPWTSYRVIQVALVLAVAAS